MQQFSAVCFALHVLFSFISLSLNVTVSTKNERESRWK